MKLEGNRDSITWDTHLHQEALELLVGRRFAGVRDDGVVSVLLCRWKERQETGLSVWRLHVWGKTWETKFSVILQYFSADSAVSIRALIDESVSVPRSRNRFSCKHTHTHVSLARQVINKEEKPAYVWRHASHQLFEGGRFDEDVACVDSRLLHVLHALLLQIKNADLSRLDDRFDRLLAATKNTIFYRASTPPPLTTMTVTSTIKTTNLVP